MNKRAFTLAETLITLTILGVVAAITVPSLINKQSDSANRTKIKKAMAVYEKALNQMIIDNDIKNDTGLAALNDATCSKTYEYFKITEKLNNATNCEFKTADRVYWNISDIQHPIISTDKDKRNDTTFEKTFTLAGYYDDNEILRINDLAVAKDTNKTNLTKVYEFVLNKTLETQQHRFGQYDSLADFNDCSSTCTFSTIHNNNCKWCKSLYDDLVLYFGNNEVYYCTQTECNVEDGTAPPYVVLRDCDEYGMNCSQCEDYGDGYCQADENGKYNSIFTK